MLESYGFTTLPMPLIEVVTRDFDLPDIHDYDALVFTSLEGVKRVADKVDLDQYKGSVFAIGPKTREYLEKEGGLRASTGKTFNSEGLAEHIKDNMAEGCKILGLRSSAATDLLRESLTEKYIYTEVQLYNIQLLPADLDIVSQGDVVFVVSASCAKSLAELGPETFKDITLVSIGPETSRNLPFPHITASVNTIQGMIDAYIDHLWSVID